jgi:urease accessory protein
MDGMNSTTAPHLNQRLSGSLQLSFTQATGLEKTVLHVIEQTPPLKVIRAFTLPDGAALAHLHNISGGVLGGDSLALAVSVKTNARAQLTTPGATRVYRHRPGMPDASQQTQIDIEPGALLEYLPDPLIPFKQARYRQSTRIQLAPGAGLFWWETIAPGREAHGERFAYDHLEMALEIHADSRPIAFERYKLCPQQAPLSSVVRLGSYLYHTTFYVCRAGVVEATWLALEEELTSLAQGYEQSGDTLWGVSTLPSDGIVIRGFSSSHRCLTEQLTGFWRLAKQKLYNRDIIVPRKNY